VMGLYGVIFFLLPLSCLVFFFFLTLSQCFAVLFTIYCGKKGGKFMVGAWEGVIGMRVRLRFFFFSYAI